MKTDRRLFLAARLIGATAACGALVLGTASNAAGPPAPTSSATTGTPTSAAPDPTSSPTGSPTSTAPDPTSSSTSALGSTEPYPNNFDALPGTCTPAQRRAHVRTSVMTITGIAGRPDARYNVLVQYHGKAYTVLNQVPVAAGKVKTFAVSWPNVGSDFDIEAYRGRPGTGELIDMLVGEATYDVATTASTVCTDTSAPTSTATPRPTTSASQPAQPSEPPTPTPTTTSLGVTG